MFYHRNRGETRKLASGEFRSEREREREKERERERERAPVSKEVDCDPESDSQGYSQPPLHRHMLKNSNNKENAMLLFFFQTYAQNVIQAFCCSLRWDLM